MIHVTTTDEPDGFYRCVKNKLITTDIIGMPLIYRIRLDGTDPKNMTFRFPVERKLVINSTTMILKCGIFWNKSHFSGAYCKDGKTLYYDGIKETKLKWTKEQSLPPPGFQITELWYVPISTVSMPSKQDESVAASKTKITSAKSVKNKTRTYFETEIDSMSATKSKKISTNIKKTNVASNAGNISTKSEKKNSGLFKHGEKINRNSY